MRITALIALALTAVALSACAGEGDPTAGHMTGTAAAPVKPTPVRVVMGDPGCHWFALGHKRTQTVKGAAAFTNYDEAALNVYGPSGYQVVKVGHSATLGKGSYTITMVGQARDDNVLHLSVQ